MENKSNEKSLKKFKYLKICFIIILVFTITLLIFNKTNPSVVWIDIAYDIAVTISVTLSFSFTINIKKIIEKQYNIQGNYNYIEKQVIEYSSEIKEIVKYATEIITICYDINNMLSITSDGTPSAIKSKKYNAIKEIKNKVNLIKENRKLIFNTLSVVQNSTFALEIHLFLNELHKIIDISNKFIDLEKSFYSQATTKPYDDLLIAYREEKNNIYEFYKKIKIQYNIITPPEQ